MVNEDIENLDSTSDLITMLQEELVALLASPELPAVTRSAIEEIIKSKAGQSQEVEQKEVCI